MSDLDLSRALLAVFSAPGPDGAPRRAADIEQAFPLVMLRVWQRFEPSDVPPQLQSEMDGLLDAFSIPRAPRDARDAAIEKALAEADVDAGLVEAVVAALALPEPPSRKAPR